MLRIYPKENHEIINQIILDDFILGARKSVKIYKEFVIKKYVRGGFFSFLNTDFHFKSKKSRAKSEYEMLDFLFLNQVHVPKPLYYIENDYFLFEKSYLVTELIQGKTLKNHNFLSSNMKYLLMEEIQKLIDLNIYHPDFNPDNVIFNDKIVILDLDKARITNEKLDILYKDRWNRYVLKHNLDQSLEI